MTNYSNMFAAMLVGICSSTCLAQIAWTEDFSGGVGRMDFVVGPGATDFVHDSTLGAIDALFDRRNSAIHPPSRRLALLGDQFTESDDLGFRVEWTPISGTSGTSWPLFGFFESTTGRDVGVVRVRDNESEPLGGSWETSLYFGDSNGFNFNALKDDGFTPWVAGETYALEFWLLGSVEQMTFSVHRLDGDERLPQGSRTWVVPEATWSVDAVGFGNLIDDQFGAQQQALVDNFSLLRATCSGDCDIDGDVDFNDLVSMLFEFGTTNDGPCDADGTGLVNFNDLTTALFLFGPCP